MFVFDFDVGSYMSVLVKEDGRVCTFAVFEGP